MCSLMMKSELRMPCSPSHRCLLSVLFRNILFFFLLPFYYCALSLPHLSFVLCSVCVWDLCRELNKKIPKNQQILMKKEMCTDSEIIASNNDDGTWADFTSRLRTAGERQRYLQIITYDWSPSLTAFTTNLLMDG